MEGAVVVGVTHHQEKISEIVGISRQGGTPPEIDATKIQAGIENVNPEQPAKKNLEVFTVEDLCSIASENSVAEEHPKIIRNVFEGINADAHMAIKLDVKPLPLEFIAAARIGDGIRDDDGKLSSHLEVFKDAQEQFCERLVQTITVYSPMHLLKKGKEELEHLDVQLTRNQLTGSKSEAIEEDIEFIQTSFKHPDEADKLKQPHLWSKRSSAKIKGEPKTQIADQDQNEDAYSKDTHLISTGIIFICSREGRLDDVSYLKNAPRIEVTAQHMDMEEDITPLARKREKSDLWDLCYDFADDHEMIQLILEGNNNKNLFINEAVSIIGSILPAHMKRRIPYTRFKNKNIQKKIRNSEI